MKQIFFFLILHFTLIASTTFSQKPAKSKRIEKGAEYQYTSYSPSNVLLTPWEMRLYDLLMKYRQTKGKSTIPLSRALSFVARTHAADLNDHYDWNPTCNFHSWSTYGFWTPCCYSKDHANAGCSWNKPKELTKYEGDGFEMICFVYTGLIPERALRKWKKNSTNNDMILNQRDWKNVNWKAVGIGIYGHYAAVWFGKVEDKEGEPERPDQ